MLLFAGPAHIGQSLTYRVTTTMSAQAAPKVSTLILTWTAPARLYARIPGGDPAGAVSIARAGDGTLSVAPPNANAADAPSVATLLGELNFPGEVAARLNGSDHAQTTLSIVPPAPVPASTAAPAVQKSPAPVLVPVDVDLVSSTASSTLIADGNSANRNSSGEDRGRRGGGMGGGWMGGGGWRSRDSDRNGSDSNHKAPPIDVALEAVFDQSGSLEHATFRETFGAASKGGQPTEETITIDRIDK